MTRVEHLKIIRLKIAELSEQMNADVLSNAFSNRHGVASVEINTNNATVVIAYDGTLTSIFEIEAIVSKLKFKLEGVGYLS
ncbi:MAG: cation transporter [Halobacteriota archaeon]